MQDASDARRVNKPALASAQAKQALAITADAAASRLWASVGDGLLDSVAVEAVPESDFAALARVVDGQRAEREREAFVFGVAVAQRLLGVEALPENDRESAMRSLASCVVYHLQGTYKGMTPGLPQTGGCRVFRGSLETYTRWRQPKATCKGGAWRQILATISTVELRGQSEIRYSACELCGKSIKQKYFVEHVTRCAPQTRLLVARIKGLGETREDRAWSAIAITQKAGETNSPVRSTHTRPRSAPAHTSAAPHTQNAPATHHRCTLHARLHWHAER